MDEITLTCGYCQTTGNVEVGAEVVSLLHRGTPDIFGRKGTLVSIADDGETLTVRFDFAGSGARNITAPTGFFAPVTDND
jgi:hypothetical protein